MSTVRHSNANMHKYAGHDITWADLASWPAIGYDIFSACTENIGTLAS
jgi:hypothetical protein